MSVFGSIMSKIFGRNETATSKPGSAAVRTASASTTQPGSGTTAPATTSTSTQSVDVEAVLNRMAAKSAQKLDWRHSIVDLMKLLGLDSSQSNRKELAQELGYTGDMSDSATMNVWLHKQVMRKLAENGGKVPDSLRAS